MKYNHLKVIFNSFTQIILPYKLIGKEKIRDGAAILVGNHYRIWDIVHMACATKDPVHFIAKQELFHQKIVGKLCNIVEAIPVSRDGNDAKAVLQAIRYLKKGEKIAMFPEGKRNKDKNTELLPLKSGAALFAIKTQAPIHPIMCLSKTKYFIRTKIIIGDSIDLSQFYDKKCTAEDYLEADKLVREGMLKTKYLYLADRYQKKIDKKNKKNKRKNKKIYTNIYLEKLEQLLKENINN